MRVLFYFLGLLAVPQSFLGEAAAREVPRAPETYLYDESNALSPEARSRINSDLRRFDTETSQQVVVAVFRSLEGDDLNDFTNRVFQSWKIGQAKKDNGVLLAVFLQDRKLRIEVGYGLEPVLTDLRSKRIIEEQIKPDLKRGDFDRAMIQGTNAIFQVLKNPGTEPARSSTKRRRISVSPVLIALWIFIALLIRWLPSTRNGTHIGGLRRRGGNWRGGSGHGGVWRGGGGFGSGGFGGGGGFSGGGGRSGGGGASGSW